MKICTFTEDVSYKELRLSVLQANANLAQKESVGLGIRG